MKKKLVCLMTACLLPLGCAAGCGSESDSPVVEQTTQPEQKFTYKDSSDGSVTITGFDIAPSEGYTLKLPESIEGKAVATIGENAFANAERIGSPLLPTNLRRIEDGAFSGSDITNLNVARYELLNIGKNAFRDCTQLEGVIAMDSTVYFGAHSFENSSVKSMTASGSNVTFGEYAFSGANELEAIDLTGTVDIGDNVFESCEKLASVVLTDCDFTMGTYAFADSGVQNVVIRNSDGRIGDYAFEGCTSLQRVDFGEGVTDLGMHTFQGCTSLSMIVLPASIISIDPSTFEGCDNLTIMAPADSYPLAFAKTNGYGSAIYG